MQSLSEVAPLPVCQYLLFSPSLFFYHRLPCFLEPFYGQAELTLSTVAMIWVWGFISDYFQTRWIPVIIQAGIGLIPGIIMSIWNVSDNAKYFSCESLSLPPPSLCPI